VTLESARFQTDSGTRIIDYMSPKQGMVEVKNRKSLPYNQQLRDFADYAAENSIDSTIIVPEGTAISKLLLEAQERGELMIKTFNEISN